MNFRDALKVVNPRVLDEDIRFDEIVEFLHRKGLLNEPVMFRVDGKMFATNFVSSRSILARLLNVGEYDIAKTLISVERKKAEIEISDFSDLGMRKSSLSELPVPKFFPRDGGRYITSGVVVAERGGVYNASVHRLMVLDENRLVARLVAPRHTYLMWRDAVEAGEDLEVAVCISTHPLFLFASSTRVETGKEFEYAAKLMNGLKLYRKDKLLIPDSEVVIFGRITSDLADEGPFVDLTGTYDRVRKQPVLEVDKVFVKEDFIYHSITPACREHQMLMGVPYEPVIFKTVSNVCKVKNVITTSGSKNYFHCIVQIVKQTEGDGKNAILAALAANPSMKGVIVVDDDIDVLNWEDVEYAIATRFQAERDFVLIKNARGSSLDPSAGETTSKWGIDATKPLGSTGFERVI